VLVFMLLLINNKDIMGEYTNSRFFDVIAWGTVIIMGGLTVLLVVTSVL
jgi:Mn2+/Fe2+ NRAMP family transporter